MADLSPAAQAVYDAFWIYERRYPDDLSTSDLAAALRAVVKQLGESRAPGLEPEELYGRIVDVDDLLAIAAELEDFGG